MNSFLEHNQQHLRRIWTALVVFIIIVSIFFAVLILNSLKQYTYIGQSDQSEHTITVLGEGYVFAKPTIATFNFSVQKTADTVDIAQSDVSTRVNEALSTLKTNGVLDKDIQTVSYEAYPKYETEQTQNISSRIIAPSKQVLVGYVVSQTISVKVRNTNRAGDVLGKLGALNVDNVSSLQLTTDPENDDSEDQARMLAIQNAKMKAQKLATSLHVRLGSVVSFNEDQNYRQTYMFSAAIMDESVSSASPSIPSGENKVTSDVQITYQIK